MLTKQYANYDEITTLPPGAMFLVDPANNGQYKRISKANAAISLGIGTGDILRPVVNSMVATSGTNIRVTFNENMQDPNLLGWLFDNGAPQFPSGVVQVSANVWDFAVSGLLPGQVIRASHNELVTLTMDLAGNKLATFNNVVVTPLAGGGGGDVTPPVVIGAVVSNGAADQITHTFDEAIPSFSTAGWSFTKNGVNWPIMSVSSPATAVIRFVMNGAAVAGDVIRRSYNSGAGNTLNAAALELISFTDVLVTNDVTGGGSGYEPEMDVYFAANTVPNTTQKGHIDDFFAVCKATGKVRVIYLPIFGSIGNNKWNLVDAQDTDAAFRLTQVGTITHGANFIKGDGSTGYLRTHFNPTVEFDPMNYGVTCFVKNFNYSDTKCAIGSGVDGSRYFGIFPDISSTVYGATPTKNLTVPLPAPPIDPPFNLFISINRLGAFDAALYVNGETPDIEATEETFNLENLELFIMAFNNGGTANRFMDPKSAGENEFQLFMIHEGLTSGEYNAIRTAWNTFKTAMGI